MFIAIEGQDGAGKDTQAELLKEYYEKQGKNVVTYAESGTNSSDEFLSTIAKLNYGSSQNIDNRTRTMLYLINRYEQWRRLAEPALKNGDVVITTRYWLSSLIYEGYGAGVSKSLIAKLHKLVMPEPYFRPDHIFVLTISEEEQGKRLQAQYDQDWDRQKEVWKSKNSEFQQKINRAYLKVAKDYNLPLVDGIGTKEEVFTRIVEILNSYQNSHWSN